MKQKALKDLIRHCECLKSLDEEEKLKLTSLDFIITANKNDGKTVNSTLFKQNTVKNLISMVSSNVVFRNKELLLKTLVVVNSLVAQSNIKQFVEIMSYESFIPDLIKLAGLSTFQDIQEQSIWILDNVALDMGETRTKLFDADVIDTLLNALKSNPSVGVIRIASCLLRDLTTKGGMNDAKFAEHIEQLIPVVATSMLSSLSHEVQLNACSILSCLLDDGLEATASEVNKCGGLIETLIQLSSASTNANNIQLFALEVLSNLTATSSEEQLKAILALDVLSLLDIRICSRNFNVLAMSAQVLMSFCCSNSPVIVDQVMTAARISKLVRLAKDAKKEVRTYSLYSLMSALRFASLSHLTILLNNGSLESVLLILKSPLTTAFAIQGVSDALFCLNELFAKIVNQPDFNFMSEKVLNAGGWDSVTELVKCEHVQVRDLALDLIKNKPNLVKVGNVETAMSSQLVFDCNDI